MSYLLLAKSIISERPVKILEDIELGNCGESYTSSFLRPVVNENDSDSMSVLNEVGGVKYVTR